MKKVFISLIILVILPIKVIAGENPRVHQPLICAGKQVLGKIEKVTLIDNGLVIDAKLDTGAAMTSLSAVKITPFLRDKKMWVQFTVNVPSATGKKLIFTKALIRYIKIRKRQEESDSKEPKFGMRPVVYLPVRIGNKQESIFVNLVNRSEFRYPMLLGSDALKKFNVLVDVNEDFLAF